MSFFSQVTASTNYLMGDAGFNGVGPFEYNGRKWFLSAEIVTYASENGGTVKYIPNGATVREGIIPRLVFWKSDVAKTNWTVIGGGPKVLCSWNGTNPSAANFFVPGVHFCGVRVGDIVWCFYGEYNDNLAKLVGGSDNYVSNDLLIATLEGSLPGRLAAVPFNLISETFGTPTVSSTVPYVYTNYVDGAAALVYGAITYNAPVNLWKVTDEISYAYIDAKLREDGTVVVVHKGRFSVTGTDTHSKGIYNYSIFNPTLLTWAAPVKITDNVIYNYSGIVPFIPAYEQWEVHATLAGDNNSMNFLVRPTFGTPTGETSAYYLARLDTTNTFETFVKVSQTTSVFRGLGYCYNLDDKLQFCAGILNAGAGFDANLIRVTDTSPVTTLTAISVGHTPAGDPLAQSVTSWVIQVGPTCYNSFNLRQFNINQPWQLNRAKSFQGAVTWENHSTQTNITHANTEALATIGYLLTHTGLTGCGVFGGTHAIVTPSQLASQGIGFIYYNTLRYFEFEAEAHSTCGSGINVSDTLNFGDVAQVSLAIAGGGINEGTPINECPDVVASSACAFIKTMDDDDPILTDCEEEIFSESGEICD